MSNEQTNRPLLTINDFKAACAAYGNRLNLILVVAVLPYFSLGAIWLFEDTLQKWGHEHFEPAYAEAVPRLTIAAAGLLLTPFLLIAVRVLFWRTHRQDRFLCPRCGQLLVDMETLVIATHNCGHCGRRVIVDTAEKGDAAC